jgi:hypothetical protein
MSSWLLWYYLLPTIFLAFPGFESYHCWLVLAIALVYSSAIFLASSISDILSFHFRVTDTRRVGLQPASRDEETALWSLLRRSYFLLRSSPQRFCLHFHPWRCFILSSDIRFLSLLCATCFTCSSSCCRRSRAPATTSYLPALGAVAFLHRLPNVVVIGAARYAVLGSGTSINHKPCTKIISCKILPVYSRDISNCLACCSDSIISPPKFVLYLFYESWWIFYFIKKGFHF